MKKCLLTAAICLAACSSLFAGSKPATWIKLNLPGKGFFQNYALSADGNVMAVNLGGEMFRWVRGKGYTDLGPTDGSIGMSEDGNAITSGILGADGLVNAGVWKASTGWVSLGHTPNGCNLDGSWGSPYGMNVDGSVVVGLAWYCPGAQAFRWSAFTGMVPLSHPTDRSSRASAISADATTTVGFYEAHFGNRRPARWIGHKVNLFAGANANGEATAVSSDGTQIVGQADDATGFHAFYYTDALGMISLGALANIDSDQSVASGIANDGTVVGASGSFFGSGFQAFYWSARFPKQKMRFMKDALKYMGAKIPNNVILSNALAISADGTTIAGTWYDTNFNSGGWMARVR